MYEKQLGEKIKRLRNEKGLSQEKYALLIEMDRTYFVTVEMGKRNISLQIKNLPCVFADTGGSRHDWNGHRGENLIYIKARKYIQNQIKGI